MSSDPLGHERLKEIGRDAAIRAEWRSRGTSVTNEEVVALVGRIAADRELIEAYRDERRTREAWFAHPRPSGHVYAAMGAARRRVEVLERERSETTVVRRR